MNTTQKIVFEEDLPSRLDVFISKNIANLSRSRVQDLIADGEVTIDGSIVKKNSFILDRTGQLISVNIPSPEPIDIHPEHLPINVIFENDDVIVINKQAGMVMHPSAGHISGTLVNAALGYTEFIAGIGGKQRPGIVHRLDRDTSGVVLVAKNDNAHQWLQKQFKNRETEKHYIALVDRHPPTLNGKIDAPLYRDPNNRKKMAVAPSGKGKKAITIFHTKEKYSRHSLLDVQILTGRTHQIRVHLASIGSPVTGDTLYGYATPTVAINRHFLHAKTLGIRLPGETTMRYFTADIPEELRYVIRNLGSKGECSGV